MISKNQISIFRKPKVIPINNYCLQFIGNGYISIDPLTNYLDHNKDFSFEMQFKINSFPVSGFNYLMNSCLSKTDNKIGIAIDINTLYVQLYKGSELKTELTLAFNDDRQWHTIFVTNARGLFSAILDHDVFSLNQSPVLSLPDSLGFRIASDTENMQNLSSFIDNILITDLTNRKAQYLLNEGAGSIAYDSVGHNNGSITNGTWSFF